MMDNLTLQVDTESSFFNYFFIFVAVEPVDARPIPDRGLPTRPGECVWQYVCKHTCDYVIYQQDLWLSRLIF